MRYQFHTCDVFTAARFGGNPLAVLPHADGLSATQMQQIAREFNFSETSFVFPPEAGGSRRVRIFTPTKEVPFAGHPNIGTAFVLATIGELGDWGSARDPGTVIFEEAAGRVPVTLQRRGDGLWCELAAPQRLAIGETVERELAAAALSLEASDIRITTHPPQVAGVGLPFLVVELTGRAALERARIDFPPLDRLVSMRVTPDICLYARSDDAFDIRTRMFAPYDGVPEDPATGSANCALIALRAHYAPVSAGDFAWRIAQGVEMGRPSLLEGRVEKRDGVVEGVWIGGSSVMFSSGELEA